MENNTEKQWENPKTLLSIVGNTDEFHSPGWPKPSHQSIGPTCLGGGVYCKEQCKVAIKCGMGSNVRACRFSELHVREQVSAVATAFSGIFGKASMEHGFWGNQNQKQTTFGRSTKFHVLSPQGFPKTLFSTQPRCLWSAWQVSSFQSYPGN